MRKLWGIVDRPLTEAGADLLRRLAGLQRRNNHDHRVPTQGVGSHRLRQHAGSRRDDIQYRDQSPVSEPFYYALINVPIFLIGSLLSCAIFVTLP